MSHLLYTPSVLAHPKICAAYSPPHTKHSIIINHTRFVGCQVPWHSSGAPHTPNTPLNFFPVAVFALSSVDFVCFNITTDYWRNKANIASKGMRCEPRGHNGWVIEPILWVMKLHFICSTALYFLYTLYKNCTLVKHHVSRSCCLTA